MRRRTNQSQRVQQQSALRSTLPVATQRPARPLWPPRRVGISLCSLAAAALMVQAGFLEWVVGTIVDQAVCNIITLILCFSGLLSLVLWFVRESGHAKHFKWLVVSGIIATSLLAVAVLRIERVSGDLVPEFYFRWNPSRDRLLPPEQSLAGKSAAASGSAAGLWQGTAQDFPKFLGPLGTGVIDSIALDPDWIASPPQLIWRRQIGAGWSAMSTCGDHAVTLEQRGDEEIVACYSVLTGAQEWSVPVSARHATVLGGIGPRSTPTICDGIVYTAGATGWLHAIDGTTGHVRWRKNILVDLGIDAEAHAAAVSWGRAGSPLVTAELVIVPAGGPLLADGGGNLSLVAFERDGGAVRWTAGSQQISYCTPILVTLAGREMVMVVNESQIAGYDPADGRTLMEAAWPGHSNSDASCTQAVVVGQRQVFVSKGYGIGSALFEIENSAADPLLLRQVWHNASNLKTKFSNVVLYQEHAYGLSDGILECVRIVDGKRQWKSGRYGQGQVLRVGSLLLVQAESGEVVLVDAAPEQQRVRGRLEALPGQTWNNPCLSGNRLLVRNAQEAACYRLPLSPAPLVATDVAAQ